MLNSHKELLDTYCEAIKNELRRDLFMHQKLGVYRYGDVIIPRAEKLSLWLQRFPRLVSLAVWWINLLWRWLIYPLYLFFRAVKSCFVGGGKRISVSSTDIFIANSPSSVETVSKTDFNGDIYYTSRRHVRSGGMDCFHILSDFCSLSDVLDAFRLSWAANRMFRMKCDVKGGALQNYVAFDWFLTWKILCRIGQHYEKIWFANDSDRWAVLFDRLPLPEEKILVQHGYLADNKGLEVNDRPGTTLPCKLKNIHKIYAYDDTSVRLFKELVLEEGYQVEFAQLKTGLALSDWPEKFLGKCRILIIGQPDSINQEIEFATQAFAYDDDFAVIFRPHPLYSSKPYSKISDSRACLLKDADIYPSAELVVMFANSSLGFFYDRSGIRTLNISKFSQSQNNDLLHQSLKQWRLGRV